MLVEVLYFPGWMRGAPDDEWILAALERALGGSR